MAYISSGTPQHPILEFLQEYGTEGLDEVPPTEIAKPTITKIFVNGEYSCVYQCVWTND